MYNLNARGVCLICMLCIRKHQVSLLSWPGASTEAVGSTISPWVPMLEICLFSGTVPTVCNYKMPHTD
jgi:hypothetical protein